MAKMTCRVCKRGFVDGDKVLPVLTYVTNAKRGDFVGSNPAAYIHARHLEAVAAPSERPAS